MAKTLPMGRQGRGKPLWRGGRIPLRLENPVARKEMRGRMRGGRAFLLLAAYVGIMSLAVLIMAAFSWQAMGLGGPAGGYARPNGGSYLGRVVFGTIGFVQLVLVSAVAPALTAGSVTIEREQLTLDLLRMTRLSPFSILSGKLASSLSYLGLLVLSSLPLMGLGFLFGGVSPAEVLSAYGLILSLGGLAGAVGLWWSVVCKRTVVATSAAYASVLLMLVGIPFYVGFLESVSQYGGGGLSEGPWMLVFMSALILSGTIPAIVAAVLTTMVLMEFRPAWGTRLTGLVSFGLYAAVFLYPLGELFLTNFSITSGGGTLLLMVNPFFTMMNLIMSELYGGSRSMGMPFQSAQVHAGFCSALYVTLAGALFLVSIARFRAIRTG
ncbi:MAG: ABC transporter permease [Armatimonadetes bacterium]|nr:ABC transporter permease [Armatimonadota bacterium]